MLFDVFIHVVFMTDALLLLLHYMNISQFICSSDRNLGCFQFVAINNTVIKEKKSSK